MRKTILIIPSLLFLLSAAPSYGESFTLTTNQPLIFSYSNIDELSMPKNIDNAFELELRSRPVNSTMMAQLVFADGGSHPDYVGKLSLKLARATGNTSVSNEVKVLGTAPIVLFQLPGSNGNGANKFTYNATLAPFTTFVSTGQCNFSVLFTMTQP